MSWTFSFFHPAHISGSMTEMDEGAPEVSRQCNDVAAINGSSFSEEIIVEETGRKKILMALNW